MPGTPAPRGLARRTFLGLGATTAGVAMVGVEPWLPGHRPAFAADGKTGPTYFTPDKVANARANVARFDWAAALRDAAVTAADPYLAVPDDQLWSMVPAQTVGRSLGVLIRYQARLLGSPGPEGPEINRFGNYPWLIDQFAEPWKITSPVTGERYPSNDFASFYAAGIDEHGEFDPELARENGSQYLVNELYPERGEGWGVDDGSGWQDPDGNVWTFIAYYCHWGLWYRTGATTYGLFQHALQSLRDAYLYTGDARYAHKGLVLLDRIADVWPAMDVTAFPWEEGFDNGDPAIHTAQGKTVNDIWETGVANYLIQAYDAFWPAIDTDPELLAFVAAKTAEFGIPTPKSTPAELRAHIEDHVLRLVLPAVQNSQIRGNTGMHHATLALAAVVLDRAGESDAMLDFCFQPGGLEEVEDPDAPYGRRCVVTGGDLARLLVEEVDRDGWGNEAAPGYNVLWLNSLLPMADAVDGYQRYPDYDLFGHLKFQRMFGANPPITMLSRYTPSIGDSGKAGSPGVVANLATTTTGFLKTGDPLQAQLIHLLAQGDLSGVHGSVFDAEPEAVQAEVAQVVAEHGPFDPATVHQAGYGFSGLRSGSGDARSAVWMYYGRSQGHGHLDCLNLGVFGAGMDLAPDLGYPEVTGTDPERLNWTAATVSHNTVVVDAASQAPQWVGVPTLLDAGSVVSAAEVEAAHCYPHVSRYRRTTALVTIDDDAAYAVDVFRVRGGRSHVFSFHGGPGEASADGLALVAQDGGSYAGPDVPFQDPDYNSAARSGFNYLTRVERDQAPPATWSVDWAVRDQWDVHASDPDAHLRLTMLTESHEVALADGIPPRNKPGNPESLRYTLVRRDGEDDLESTFTSVLEPCVGASRLRSVRRASLGGGSDPSSVSAVRVELEDGRVDYVVSSLDDDVEHVIDDRIRFRGRLGVIRIAPDGTVELRHLHGARILELLDEHRPTALAEVRGVVATFTQGLEPENEVVLEIEPIRGGVGRTLRRLTGAWVHIDTDGERNGSYRIESARLAGRDRLRLSLGAQTLVRGLADPDDADGGYVYDLVVGAPARVPLTWES
ncbi:Heparinase II/III family protein [Beutenbergia cavernae DSM 12333]|uniref:Heparinase II/III family protein n=1 Tax=Beutenbergia cavernae (strain ATCC BAA-8 / DSM 12333 / CCUG 43141 / JCM 11478 / NBRC 16432 / NCIMB 13614 / HKI 0122) TaxID=471853 RepID=C5C1G7_BEUC1|nr:heparinase II/III family protein [Beutenbergia cavernae]ACQ81577.1 Heparinase II/III family protein [Beutenbergia cavernae DSM 12333]